MRNLDLLVPQPEPDRGSWRWATVTQTSPLRIRFDGETTALPITPESLVTGLDTGTRVWCQVRNNRITVHGAANGSLLQVPVSIGAGKNLNTYTTTGIYHQHTNANAASGTNYPVALAGLLEVVNAVTAGFIYQTYTTYGSATEVWKRTYYNGTWYGWRREGGDTGWVEVPTLSGYVEFSSLYSIDVLRDGDTVFLRGLVKPTSGSFAASTEVSVATVPAGFRPTQIHWFAGMTTTGQGSAGVRLNTDGTINIRAGQTALSFVGLGTSWTVR